MQQTRRRRSSPSCAAIPSPPGEEREVADRVAAYLARLGIERRRGRRRRADRVDAGNLSRGSRRPPTAACRSSSARISTPSRRDGPLEPVARGRRRPERGRHDPRRGQQGGRRGHARGDAARRSPTAGRTPGSSCSSRRRRRSACSARPHSTPRGSRRRSATSTTRQRRSARSSSARRTRTRCEIRFHGRASHSGMYPEEGRSAIAAAARAIADFRLGRVDEETTANVGVINGGTARNIVPEWCTLPGRGTLAGRAKAAPISFRRCSRRSPFAAELGECEVETEMKKSYRGYRFKQDDLAVRLATRRSARERPRADVRALGRRRRRERLQRARPPVRQPRQRDGEHPHARRAHRRRRPRGDDRRHPRRSSTQRGMPLSLRRGVVTRDRRSGCDGLVRIEVDGTPCVAYPRLTGPVALGDEVLVNVEARELGLGSGGFDVLLREPDPRARAWRPSRART